jgi:hypothetical protein
MIALNSLLIHICTRSRISSGAYHSNKKIAKVQATNTGNPNGFPKKEIK